MSGDFKNMSSLFQTDVLRFFLKCKNYSMRILLNPMAYLGANGIKRED